MEPTFFRTAAEFRRWLKANGARESAIWIGFNKKSSGLGGMTYQEAVDEALCHGWIDGLLKSIDATCYKQRFTPRTPRSYWSAINIAKVKRLEAAGRMTPAGRAAFEGHEARHAPYSHESGPKELSGADLKALRANPPAWAFYRVQPPSVRKAVAHWIANAKQEATRARRLALLIRCSAEGRLIPQFISPKGPAPKR
jgi:uncharacterized protein YdeI (YjbR/CyaY-like superfamily)